MEMIAIYMSPEQLKAALYLFRLGLEEHRKRVDAKQEEYAGPEASVFGAIGALHAAYEEYRVKSS
jgi:hypothetical protein